jgi:hypothetical protein
MAPVATQEKFQSLTPINHHAMYLSHSVQLYACLARDTFKHAGFERAQKGAGPG